MKKHGMTLIEYAICAAIVLVIVLVVHRRYTTGSWRYYATQDWVRENVKPECLVAPHL